MTKEESVLYAGALSFAAKKHAGALRRNGMPYIYHPIRVAMHLAEAGYDIRYQIVGLFHDLLEDTDATVEELSEFCDEEMLKAVRLVTKEEGFIESEYIERILNNPFAKAVKNADRIDNFRDLFVQDDEEFRERYIKNTEEFFVGKFSKELDDLYYENVK